MICALLTLISIQSICSQPTSFAQEITFARPDIDASISVSADEVTRWRQGVYEILHLRGDVRIRQQQMNAAAGEAILWVETPGSHDSNSASANATNDVYKIIAYLEDQVVIDLPRPGAAHQEIQSPTDRIVDEKWLGRFFTRQTVDLNRTAHSLSSDPPQIFARAQTALESGASGVRTVALAQPTQPFTQPLAQPLTQPLAQPLAPPQGQVLISPQTGALQTISPQPTPAVADPFSINNGSSNPSNQIWQPDNRPQNFSSVPSQATESPMSAFRQTPTTGTPNSPFDVQITSRDSSSGLNLKSFVNPQNPNERVSIGVGGFRIGINSPDISTLEQFRADQDQQVNILADNLVQWSVTNPDGLRSQQFYLEGNVVFSKDRRVIYAQRMFYDVNSQRGTILDAEVLTPIPEYRGLVRLKADVVQQVDANNLQAYGTSFTSSRLGVPRYWLQSDSVALTRQQVQQTDPNTFAPLFDPTTGQPVVEDEYFVESQDNRVYMGGVPVFAWPRFRTNLNDPSMYVERISVNNDNIFGFQAGAGFDLYQLLGWKNPPRGSRWIGNLDYLSERGLGYGTEFSYQRNELFGIPGIVEGDYKSWFIKDEGLDVLGQDRLALTPEEERRGRIFGRHRHRFGPGYNLKAELGYISDRNFLEQYYEREWDTGKDATTGVWLERSDPNGTRSFNLTADVQINDFFAQTTWLPRYDQFVLGQALFGDRAVWHGHAHLGYAKLRAANAPTNASEIAKFDPLAWEADVDGIRGGLRQEIDFPMQVGPWKVVPYLLGDVTYWQEDLTGNDLLRGLAQTGVRASLPIWKADPTVQSTLWNVNGLAHKVNFDVEAFIADSSQDLGQLPLYDQLDDDAQEHFRRRFAFDTFGIIPGGNVPLQFDERYFALRSGMQSNVTAPSMEIADDLAIVKMGVRQRWQTKRGLPGNERVIDWITLDAQTTLFPDADRDNFGSDFGMFDYDFRWNVGNRFALVSDGYFDFFSQGLRTASFGANIGRPEIGNAYVGYRMIEGPISSNIVTANLTYRMSEKWGVKAGGQVDFGETGSIGQTLSFVHIGESFLMQFGINYDVSRDNAGFRFGFEPRFTNRPRLFRPGGVALAPASSRYLE